MPQIKAGAPLLAEGFPTVPRTRPGNVRSMRSQRNKQNKQNQRNKQPRPMFKAGIGCGYATGIWRVSLQYQEGGYHGGYHGAGIGVPGRVSEYRGRVSHCLGRVSEYQGGGGYHTIPGGYRSTGGGYCTVAPRIWHPSENFNSLCFLNLLLFVSDCACRWGVLFFFLVLLCSSVAML